MQVVIILVVMGMALSCAGVFGRVDNLEILLIQESLDLCKRLG